MGTDREPLAPVQVDLTLSSSTNMQLAPDREPFLGDNYADHDLVSVLVKQAVAA
jgi:hypothetical protein